MKTIIALLFFTLTAAAQTNEVFETLVVGSKTYTNCTVKALSPVDGMVKFDGGGAKIKLEDLPEPQRSLFYDAGKASEFLGDKQAAKEKRMQAAKDAGERAAEIFRIVNCRVVDGVVVDPGDLSTLDGKVAQVEKNFLILEIYEIEEEYVSFRVNREARVGNFIGGGGPAGYTKKNRVLNGKRVHVICDTSGVIDGADKVIKAKKVGTYKWNGSTVDSYNVGLPYNNETKPK